MSAPKKKLKPSFQIDDLNLHPNIIHKLKAANLNTFKMILHLSSNELQKIAKLSPSEAITTIEGVSLSLIENKAFTAFNLARKGELPQDFLTLDVMEKSDTIFNGIYTGTITEISGESGCGKTQICLYLSILAQLPTSAPFGGLNTKVIYIHSEGDFPVKRFMQMANAFKVEHPEIQEINLSSNLILRKVHNLNATMHVLQKGIPDLVKKINPKLIIIDSVAALLRSNFESVSERTSTIQHFAAEIWKLANVYGMAVICVNQVSGHSKQNTTAISNIAEVPSLGLLWSNILTTRLKISRKISNTEVSRRVLECIHSSYHPHMAVEFTISETGIKVI